MKARNTEIRIVKGCVTEVEAGAAINGTMFEGGGESNEAVIRKACADAFQCNARQKTCSIIFSALKSGTGGVPVIGVAKILSQEILKYVRGNETSLKEIVVYLPDEKMRGIFEQTISGYITHIQDTLGEGPYVTVDAIIELPEGIILIERSNPPYGWALPGGFVDCGESLEDAVVREAKEETNMDLVDLRQLHTYSDPDRDPRFYTVSTVFVAKGKGVPEFGDDAKGLKIIKYDELLKFNYAFDHKKIIEKYLKNASGMPRK